MAALEFGSSSLRVKSVFILLTGLIILFIFRKRWSRGLSLRRGRGQNTDSGRSAGSGRSRRSVRRSRCGQAAAETLRTQELRDGGHPVVRQPDLGPLEPDGPEKKVRALIFYWLHSWGLFHDRLNISTLTLIRDSNHCKQSFLAMSNTDTIWDLSCSVLVILLGMWLFF